MEQPDQFELANARARELQSTLPRAVSARYDRRIGRIVLHLSTGIDLVFPPHIAQGLETATPAQLAQIEISPSGFGIHFPSLDSDLYLPALLEGFLGSRKWMAGRLGAHGGKSTSPAKTAAAQRNGRNGGRPRKKTNVVA
jgi:hypothetical protein